MLFGRVRLRGQSLNWPRISRPAPVVSVTERVVPTPFPG